MKSQSLNYWLTSEDYWDYRVFLLRFSILSLLVIWITGFIYPIISSGFNPLMNYIMKEFYSTVCHQDGSKCIYIGADSMLICARCTGIYLGGFVTGLLSLFILNFNLNKRILFYSAVPMILDVALNTLGVYPYSKTIAFSTGLILGSVIYYFIISEIENFIINRRLRGNEQ